MSMRVTMRSPRRSEDGLSILTAAGSPYVVSNEYGAYLVAGGWAVDLDGALRPAAPFAAMPYTATQLSRAAARFKLKRTAPAVYFSGDSYANGNGATGGNGFAQQLATEIGAMAAVGNYAYSGRSIPDYTFAPKVSGTGPADASQVLIARDSITCVPIGLNDIRGIGTSTNANGCGPNPDRFAALRSKVQGMAVHWLTPEAAKVRMTNVAHTVVNPALTLGAAYTVGFGGRPDHIYMATDAGTISFTTPVGDLLVLRPSRDAAGISTWTPTVDGVVYPSFTTRTAYDNWTEDCVLIKLPTVAAHTVVLTPGTVAGTESAMMGTCACVDTTTDFSASLIYTTPPYLNDGSLGNAGWNIAGANANSATAASAVGSAAWAYGNGAVDRFSAAIDDAMHELWQLGFNVIKAPLLSGWEKSTMLAADFVHPNDLGHGHYKRVYRQPLFSLLVA
jgi:hypothetical protein